MRRLVHIVAAVFVLAAAGAVALHLGRARDDAAPTFLTAPIERGDLRAIVTATGRVDAVLSVHVGSQLSGQIAALLADFNDQVQAGQPIARLDDRTYEAHVREARARLASARAELAVTQARRDGARARAREAKLDLQRKASLHASGRLSATDRDRARAANDTAQSELAALQAESAAKQAAVEVAAATLHAAEIDMQRTVIRAPIDGVVIGRDVDEGQTVAASLKAPTLFTIAHDLKHMKVLARVDEADIGRIAPGQRAMFTVDAYPGRRFPSEVVQIRKAPEVVENVVTYTVVLGTDNTDLALLPGMTAIVRIVVRERTGVLEIPNAALRYRPPGAVARGPDTSLGAGASTVWVLDANGHPAPREVRVGFSDGNASELVGGALAAGDAVIVGQRSPAPARSLFGLRLGF